MQIRTLLRLDMDTEQQVSNCDDDGVTNVISCCAELESCDLQKKEHANDLEIKKRSLAHERSPPIKFQRYELTGADAPNDLELEVCHLLKKCVGIRNKWLAKQPCEAQIKIEPCNHTNHTGSHNIAYDIFERNSLPAALNYDIEFVNGVAAVLKQVENSSDVPQNAHKHTSMFSVPDFGEFVNDYQQVCI